MSQKKIRVNARISEDQQHILDQLKIGKTAAVTVGITTLKLYVQRDSSLSCVYLYNTGKNRTPPDAASDQPPAPIAQGCPCPVCPLRAAFGHMPHVKCGQKENRSIPAADDPISCS